MSSLPLFTKFVFDLREIHLVVLVKVRFWASALQVCPCPSCDRNAVLLLVPSRRRTHSQGL